MQMRTVPSLKSRFTCGKPMFGVGVSGADPAVMELIALAGYDVAVLDCCHQNRSPEAVREMLRAAQCCDLPVVVRVAALSDAPGVMNFGAAGLMFDQVQSLEEAREIIRVCKYAPLGERGMCAAARAKAYGACDLVEAMRRENEEVLLFIQIEDRKGMDCMEQIMSLPGVDVITSGRSDLSQAFGVPGQTAHPDVLAAEEAICACADRHGLPVYLNALHVEHAKRLLSQGRTALQIGNDQKLLFDAMRACLDGYRRL